MTRLTVPISANSPEQALQQIKAAKKAGAEMLELRTDYIEGLNADLVKNLVASVKGSKGKTTPVIVTCRDKRQGGAIDYPLKLRMEVLIAALKAGADFIDFEYDNFLTTENQEKIRLALSQSSMARLILSAHDFEKKFADITRLFRSISTICPGTIPKLVYAANHINDCFDALDLLHRTSGERIVFCMGEDGLISRILAKKFGGFVTFASIDEQSATAPGQLNIEQLKQLYRYDDIEPGTELFGVIAEPVGHSLSPAIHNACFTEMKMNRLYLPLLVRGYKREFDSFLNNVLLRKWLNFRGFSVTIPHKRNALNYAGTNQGFIEPLAGKIGAVNTLILRSDGKVKAYNTDYSAALDAIISGMKIKKAGLKDLPVAVVGAGGVARAIVAGLSDAGAKIRIYNRTVEKAQKLAAEFNCESASLDELENIDAKLLVNCTSIGMHPNIEATPVSEEYLNKNMAVFDTVYNPAETLLLKNAKSKRAKRIDGVTMFVNQAMAQFKLFTGTDGNPTLMRKTITEAMVY
ncbi:MAG: shikimate dehydrogenase [Sedimentisphaerales bacterium]|nr:shikimate dehydrogenase [Sedimentisphaerales bacterium]